MHTLSLRSPGCRRLLAAAALLAAGSFATAQAAVVSYAANLDGASEASPNASPGTGFAQVDIDDVAHTMHLVVSFSGLQGTVTASHIHAATAVAGTGAAGVATTTPTFAGFPSGVTAGFYDNTLNMTSSTSFNASYITNNGGTTASAEAALFAAIAAGKAYLNIHSSMYTGGEIRGFLQPLATPSASTTWGQVKALYR